MLIISRRIGESIRIGDATVTITSIRGSHVRLGVVAPRDCVVSRLESADRTAEPDAAEIKTETRTASTA